MVLTSCKVSSELLPVSIQRFRFSAFSVSVMQYFSYAAFQQFSVSVTQHFRYSTIQQFGISTTQHRSAGLTILMPG
jgi:hypothetical protein